MPLTENRATELITHYLSDHPHINVLSDVHYAHITDERGRLTRYRSGDRYVFVESDFTPSLPTNTQIGQYNVRVKHPSQELYCYRCKSANLHRTNDVKECKAYNPDESSVEPFKADWNILSNFFVCHVVAFGRVFRSAEHAYQYRKCRDCLRNDLADKVIRAATPKKAKDIAAEIDPRDLDKWHKSSGHKVVMAEVLLAKARSNIDFKRKLMNTGDKLIVECTRDAVWGVGLTPHQAITTKPEWFKGANLGGVLLMELRQKLSKENATTKVPTSTVSKTAINVNSRATILDGGKNPNTSSRKSLVAIRRSSNTELPQVAAPRLVPPESTSSSSSSTSVQLRHSSPPDMPCSVPSSTSTTPSKPRRMLPLIETVQRDTVEPSIDINRVSKNSPPRRALQRQAQSPLVGKVATTLRRRIIDPAARKLVPINNCESELDSDDDSCYERESIASEKSHIEDKGIVTMDDFEGLQF